MTEESAPIWEGGGAEGTCITEHIGEPPPNHKLSRLIIRLLVLNVWCGGFPAILETYSVGVEKGSVICKSGPCASSENRMHHVVDLVKPYENEL